jgi:hypothetical protein
VRSPVGGVSLFLAFNGTLHVEEGSRKCAASEVARHLARRGPRSDDVEAHFHDVARGKPQYRQRVDSEFRVIKGGDTVDGQPAIVGERGTDRKFDWMGLAMEHQLP